MSIVVSVWCGQNKTVRSDCMTFWPKNGNQHVRGHDDAWLMTIRYGWKRMMEVEKIAVR